MSTARGFMQAQASSLPLLICLRSQDSTWAYAPKDTAHTLANLTDQETRRLGSSCLRANVAVGTVARGGHLRLPPSPDRAERIMIIPARSAYVASASAEARDSRLRTH